MWIKFTFFLSLLLFCETQYTKISSKPAYIIFEYRGEAQGELTLKECKHNEACNVVHKRFWMPNLAQRLCRCPNGIECSWSSKFDNQSIILNNRSVLKFCEPVSDRKICKPRQKAAIVRGKIDGKLTSTSAHNVTVNCICPKSHYWKLFKYSYADNHLYQFFKCAKQRECYSYDFCGIVRSDFFSIYHRCSCPIGNLCITQYNETQDVQELMYTGPGYEAFCNPWNSTSKFI